MIADHKLTLKNVHSSYYQGGLTKKTQLNLCNIFSIFTFNELYYIRLMTLNRVNLGAQLLSRNLLT